MKIGKCELAVRAMMLIVIAGLCLMIAGAAMADKSKPVVVRGKDVIAPKVGEAVDVAPFGEFRSWNNGKDIGVLWEDTREIFKVAVKFADKSAMPDPANVKLQYWKTAWPQERVPRDAVLGSGNWGWIEAGDWYNGKWRDADVDVVVNGDKWTYTFRPINKSEYDDLDKFDATYRTTLKLRILFPEKAPEIAALNTFTDSTWQQTSAIVGWGGTANSSEQIWDGKAEVYNGYLAAVRPLAGSKVNMKDGGNWSSTVKDTTDGVVIDYWYAKPVSMHSFDETVVTVRAKQHNFSFAGREVADGKRIFIRDYGVLLKPVKDATTYADAEAAYQKAQKTVYQKVAELPEQKLERAWSDMPQKGRIYMPVAVEGGRQHFRIRNDANVQISSNWHNRVKGEDSGKCLWPGRELYINFGIPRDNGATTGASIEDGNMPIVTTWYERDGVRYTEDAFATTLVGKLPKEGRVRAEEPQVLMLRFRLTNFGDKPAKITIPIDVKANKAEELVLRDGLIYGKMEQGEALRMYVNANGAASLTANGTQVNCEIGVPSKETREFFINMAFQTLSAPAEIEQLKSLDYTKQHDMIASYWRKRIAQGCQIVTPEPMLNDFYSANITHQLINTENEVGTTERAMPKVGTFYYGVYCNESVMMLSEIDRRGFHDVAQKAYETWLHYQSTARLPGDYTNQDGVFYGANRYEEGGYNQHHGWALWGMAEHYWFTRDNAWLNHAAPNIVKACDWITNQRSRTKTDECVGIRAIEYGLLPPGSLEDIGDWRSWMSNNVFSQWGMENAARALAETGHPEANRLLKEAADYKADIRKAFFEAMDRSPVVALVDGTYIPSIPSEVHRRGRSFGWITETLEGSIHMLRCGLIDPDEPMAKWIMQDYEDNRYLSQQFGYQIPFFERDWFSLGGFSQQPSLLCSPTPYIMRDEPKHYLRSYFNAFSAGYFPERAMLTEHPLPNLGDFRGDHFKSSDEAMNTSWIRWMFIWDEGKDLYLGKTMPRYWLADGKEVKIERAQTHFGQMSMSMKSLANSGRIEMTITPPTRNLPGAVYARFRHPEGKSMNRVTVNGKAYGNFDPIKEWVVLPALKEKTVVVAYYD